MLPLSALLVHCGDDGGGAAGTDDDANDDGATTAGAGGSGTGGEPSTGGVGNTGTGGIPEGGEDTVAPTIVTISPADGASGVYANTNIMIEFSEPMDKVATQAAYQSTDIPAGAVTFEWNSHGTVLTINPVADLAYAEGGGPDDVTAQSFAITLSAVATDEAGNALADPVDISFSTLRRLEQTFSRVAALSGLVRSDTGLVGTSTWIGDTSSNGQYKGFASMDIAGLPEGIVEFETATLRMQQLSSSLGVPYAALGDNVNVHHVTFDVLNLAAMTAPTLSMAGVLSSDDDEEFKELSVLSQVESDYAAGDGLAQFRFEFPIVTNFDEEADAAIFHTNTSQLVVRYLME